MSHTHRSLLCPDDVSHHVSSLFRLLDPQEDGCAVDIHHFNSGAQSVLAYATVNGSLVGWDLRSNSNAWTLRHDLRLGLITSFSVDMHQCWLCLGLWGLLSNVMHHLP